MKQFPFLAMHLRKQEGSLLMVVAIEVTTAALTSVVAL
jgi:hypothetical protein